MICMTSRDQWGIIRGIRGNNRDLLEKGIRTTWELFVDFWDQMESRI